MKIIKKYYAHFSVVGLLLFAYTCAYYSAPMLPSVEIEFKSTVNKDYNGQKPKIERLNKDIKNI